MSAASVRRILRVLLAQLAGIFAILLVLLLLTSLIADILDVGKRLLRQPDERASLPSYADREAAERIFEDSGGAPTRYEPFIVYRRDPISSPTTNVDASGYRVHTAGADAGPDDPHVGFFGGSTVWGTGVTDDETLPAVFDQQTQGLRVSNFGESGWTSRQSVALLVNLLNQGEPIDVAIFYDGFNDVWTLCNAAVTESLNGQSSERMIRQRMRSPHRWGRLFHHLIEPLLEVYDGLSGRREASDRFLCDSDPEHAERVAETLLRNWEIGHRLVTGAGGRFYAFLQPVLFSGAPRRDHLEIDEDMGAQFDAVYPLIERKLAERGWDWATVLTDALDGDDYLYIDTCHVVGTGNRRIAERIVQRLASVGGLASGASASGPAVQEDAVFGSGVAED